MKRFVTFLLIFCLLFSMTSTVFAADSTSSNFRNYFEDFYSQDYLSYCIMSKNSNDITKNFYNATKGFYNEGNWREIENYFNQNVSSVSKQSTTTTPQSARGTNLSKSTTISYIVLKDVVSSGHPLFNDTTIRVFYDLKYEFYYDDVTHQITSAIAPRLGSTSYEFVDSYVYLEGILQTSILNRSANISSGKSYVDFSHSFSVSIMTTEGYNYTSSYGTITDNYTMNV